MKVKVILTGIIICSVLASCSFFKQKKAEREPVFAMIDSAQLFEHKVIDTFAPSPGAVVYARKLYLNAVNLLVNKKNAKASLPVFVKSLRINPISDTYLKYGDALYANGNYDDAVTVYYMAGYRVDNPEASYARARCYAVQKDSSSALEELDYAFQNYPFEKEQVDKDKAFDSIRDMQQFKLLVAKYLSGSEAARNERLLTLFEKNFYHPQLPYSINIDSVTFANSESIDYGYNDLIADLGDGEFSREVSYDFQYVAALNISPDYKAFVYRKVDVVSDTLNPIHTYLVTMDTMGTLIAQQEISCYCSPLTLKTCAIDTDGNIEVKEIMQTWKDDPIYKGYEGNEVLKQEVKGVSYFKIDREGNIDSLETANDPSKAPEVVNVTTR